MRLPVSAGRGAVPYAIVMEFAAAVMPSGLTVSEAGTVLEDDEKFVSPL